MNCDILFSSKTMAMHSLIK
ncbi:hypothetical protein X777_12307 [Ooceraea biroi]|uniref:Uncharacterized protein n=1 Tax=Ooceraea biroi TaxID=2015173 RepID=A0A026W0I9_OOCBI|nr:hypothetical protein X777_12307 [Ooceraea biroi]